MSPPASPLQVGHACVSGAPLTNIPDNNSGGETKATQSSLPVGTAASVSVTWSHTYQSDLAVYLVAPSGAELLVSAAISSHATSHTRKRDRLGSRLDSGSDKKKARGSPGELAPATASSTALRCIYL